jgi:hypothetical protein
VYIRANKGTYGCNNRKYFSKLEAILESNLTGQQVHWDFYDDIFSKYNWSTPSSLSIDQLYKERALQLREEYDHLVLFYSSGVDSGYILKTFIDNNIKLDEIYIFGAFEAEKKKFKELKTSTDPGYYTREIEYIAKPTIKEILKKLDIKITIFDWEKEMLDATNDLDWFWQAGCRFGPDMLVKNDFHKRFHKHSNMTHKGKQVGFIYGVDKPRLFRDDENVYFSFLDIILTTGAGNKNDIIGETWENDEYFYWNPNFPEIPIKQAHMVVDYLKVTGQLNTITHINNNDSMHVPDFYQISNRIIYPRWDHNLWQIKKPTSSTYHEVSKWFLDSDTIELKRWESSLGELERQIGTKWFNNNTIADGLNGHISKLYKICKLPTARPIT